MPVASLGRMSDTTPRASDDESTPVAEDQPTPLADETARELNTGEQRVQPSPDPADQTDTAAVTPLPPDYRPVAASEHVAPQPAVPTASTSAATDSAPVTPDEASVDRQPAGLPADPTDPQQHSAAVAAAAAESDAPADAAPAQPAADGAPTTVAPVAQPAPAPAPAAQQTAPAEPAPTTSAYAGPTYISAPTPPKKKSNRGIGILIAVLGVVVFAAANLAATLGILIAVLAAVVFAVADLAATYGLLLIRYGEGHAADYFATYAKSWDFWLPLAVFTAAFIALVAIVNRGRWWGYVLGSIFVAVLVFAAYYGAALLTSRAWNFTPSEFRNFTHDYFLTNITYLWVATLVSVIALEVVIWFGAWVAFHGQAAKRKNLEARAAYEAELEASASRS